MLTNGEGFALGLFFFFFLVHCTLLSTYHIMDQSSVAWPCRSAAASTRSELVNMSGCMRALLEWTARPRRGGETDTWKGSRVAWMAVADDPKKTNKKPPKHCSHYAVLEVEEKEKKGSPVEMKRSPLDLLSCDIFVFQPSIQPKCSSSHLHQQSYISFFTYLLFFCGGLCWGLLSIHFSAMHTWQLWIIV